MSALPESVRRAAELSNQLSAKMKAGTLTFEDTQMSPQAVQMPAPQAPMPRGFQAQPAGDGAPGLGGPGFNPQPAELPVAQAPRAPAAAPNQPAPQSQPAAAPVSEETNDHRFKVLQGKYNAEVPRLHKQTQEQQRELQALRDQLNSTQSLLASFGAAQAQNPVLHNQPAPQPSLVTDKDTKEFGADLIELMQRVAQQTVGPKIRTLEEQFRPVAETVSQLAPAVQQTRESQAQTAAEVAHERMCNALDQNLPQWESINNSPEFHTWLALKDPYAGAERGAMLAQAYGNGDVTRVINFFTGFMKEHAAVAPTGQPQTPTPTGQTPSGTPNVSLASLAAPGTGVGGPASAGAPNESGQQRVYTQAEIGAFYKDVQKGAYKGREADRAAIERELFNATKQGRVRP